MPGPGGRPSPDPATPDSPRPTSTRRTPTRPTPRRRADRPTSTARRAFLRLPHAEPAGRPRPRGPAPVPPRAACGSQRRRRPGRSSSRPSWTGPASRSGPGVLAVPDGPGRPVADARRDQRHGSPSHRPRGRPVRRGDHRAHGGQPRADRRGRHRRGPALPVGPRPGPAAVHHVDAVGPAHVARPGRGRAQRPDGDAAAGSPSRTSRSCPRSRTCWPASSRRAGCSARPRPRSRSSRRSTRPATS